MIRFRLGRKVDDKIAAIKEFRSVTGSDLRTAKEAVEAAMDNPDRVYSIKDLNWNIGFSGKGSYIVRIDTRDEIITELKAIINKAVRNDEANIASILTSAWVRIDKNEKPR